jgi:hypothetical protein
MEQERQEVYERIPWETLEKKRVDRQWIVYAVAGAVVLGALAYSFMRSQPMSAPPAAAEASPAATVPATTVATSVDATPATLMSPVVVAEADLYAIDRDQLAGQAAGHAEWFAVEYVAVDGSDESLQTLASLLPEGIPPPEAPEGIQVFVDWARASTVSPTGPTSFEVGVLIRSLASAGDEGFVRQRPFIVTVNVEIGEDGIPRVTGAPSIGLAEPGRVTDPTLVPVPEELAVRVAEAHGEVVGGLQRDDGTWEVVVLAEGRDGVKRPVTIRP